MFRGLLDAVETLENTLRCEVCTLTLENPIIIGSCGHTFCKKCVSEYKGKECPSCAIPVKEQDAQEDKKLKELLPLVCQLRLLVEKNMSNKCKSTIPDDNKEACSNEEASATVPKHGRLTRTPKPIPCRAPNCCNGSKLGDQHEHADKSVKTPLNKTLSAASFKSSKKTPRRFSFSSKCKLLKKAKDTKLFSPPNIERKNLKGETLLHASVIKGDVQKVEELLKMKANPNVEDNAGWTPLHEACNHGFLEIVQLLVEYGAELDDVSQNEITPLHDSIMNGHMKVAYYLASKGANIYAKTSLGNTALDLCESEACRKALLRASENFAKVSTSLSEAKEMSGSENEKMLLLCTSLDESQKEKFEKCAQLMQACTTEDFSPDVTHIVTASDANGQCNRTLKILKGILSARWIVSMQWVEICLEYKKRVSEEIFEIPGTKQMPDTFGPKRARENAAKKLPPLFHSCSFYIYGPINPPVPAKEDICHLIQLGGGRLLSREPRPETVDAEHSPPFHARDTALSDVSHFILYQEKPPRNTQIRDNHIYTVTVRWFIECICAFKLLNPDE